MPRYSLIGAPSAITIKQDAPLNNDMLLSPVEYYPNCEVVFMGMANIHSIRKSFQSLRFLCTQMPDPAK